MHSMSFIQDIKAISWKVDALNVWRKKTGFHHVGMLQTGRTPGMLIALNGNKSLPLSLDSKEITKQVRGSVWKVI
jgi:hypothetical protein